MFESSVMKMYLYAAYLDVREENPNNETLVRITAVVYKLEENSVNSFLSIYKWKVHYPVLENLTCKCQIWFPDLNEPVISQVVINHSYFGLKNNLPTSVLMSCALPKTHQTKIPTSISIVEDKECH